VVDADAARAIVRALPASVMKVGVVVNQPADDINAAAERIGLTHVQLHGDESSEDAAAIERPIIKATSASAPLAWDDWAPDTMWLVDAHDPIRRGGTGQTANWLHATTLARERRVLLAGGLTPENVAEAIAIVRPFGIDVSSGVEKSPGIKDHARIRQLFEAVGRTIG
jgi:phosphoribosylanthranilate isomerase